MGFYSRKTYNIGENNFEIISLVITLTAKISAQKLPWEYIWDLFSSQRILFPIIHCTIFLHDGPNERTVKN